MNEKIEKTYYCMDCNKEFESQDEHEECFYSGHEIKVRLVIEREYNNKTQISSEENSKQ